MKVMTNQEAKSLAKLYHKEETYKHVDVSPNMFKLTE